MKLIDRIREMRPEWLKRSDRIGQSPCPFILDMNFINTAHGLYSGSFADDSDEASLDATWFDTLPPFKLPMPFVWFEFPWGNNTIGILLSETLERQETGDDETGVKIINYSAVGSAFACPTNEDGLYTENRPVAFWRYENEETWEVAGSFANDEDESDEGYYDDLADAVKGVLKLFGSSHLTTETHSPSRKDKRLSFSKRLPTPIVYKTLAINLPAVSPKPIPQGGRSDIRFHLVRGHYVNYQHQRFKNKGPRFRQPHTRGNADIGVVIKDYAVGEASS